MVSKLSAVFRHFQEAESNPPVSGSRKRSGEGLDDAPQDVLETPTAKRRRQDDDVNSSPIYKVASWIRQKATSFGDLYFFRPVGNLVKRAHPDQLCDNATQTNSQSTHTQDMNNFGSNREVDGERSSTGKTSRSAAFNPAGGTAQPAVSSFKPLPKSQLYPKLPSTEACEETDGSQQARGRGEGVGLPPGAVPKRNPFHTAHPLQHKGLNRHQSKTAPGGSVVSMERESLQQTRHSGVQLKTHPGNLSESLQSSTLAGGRAQKESPIPVYKKLFPEPKRRVVVSHATRRRAPRPTHNLTVRECIKMKEREQYAQLLRQYTREFDRRTVGVDRPEATPTSSEDARQEQSAARRRGISGGSLSSDGKDSESQPSVPIAQLPQEPSQAQTQSQSQAQVQAQQAGARVLPHNYSTQSEVREAVRRRLHVPVSQLSPSSPQVPKPAPTPAQPDFDDSASPVLLSSVTPAPSLTTPSRLAFQKKLSASPYVSEDWIKDLKERFQSSVRMRDRQEAGLEAKLKIYEERREQSYAKNQEVISERMREIASLPPVTKDIIYHPEQEQVEIEVLSDEEDEEEDEEEEEDDGVEEDDQEDDLPELTEEMDREIDMAFRPQPANEGLVSGFRLTITRRDMQTLAGLNWLNDEVMNFYFEMLMARSNEEGFPNVHSFNTYFYPRLTKSGYSGVRRWTKKIDIFSKDLILFPIHLGVHWCLAVIDFRSKSIVFYDSMGSHNQQCLDALRDYLGAEHADKKKCEFPLTGWTYRSERLVPQQQNGSDCGMFACKYAEYISRDAPITFTQLNMPYFRRRMVWEILHKTLL